MHVLFGSGGHDANDNDSENEDDVSEAYWPSHALSIAEIQDVVGRFARAAKRAVFDAGFDGVEIHGGNGYLVDSFTHDSINTRDDEYGGCLRIGSGLPWRSWMRLYRPSDVVGRRFV
ncbi:uncharacterized protein LDX57_007601 [Aspergillus melleus]|uniref:uncharacterized protein n=1 Tax=Aspergillus melleus TaxID=138277 RepID=UPI001E8D8612|nr:uncharacterized protein LDX57_007601 [Aspergillus melleus]KAH8429928.1 hypothetical protein LDX57_007601 [Aspergillus melleus]